MSIAFFNMSLLAQSITSTTATYLQLEELNEKKKPGNLPRQLFKTKELRTAPSTLQHEEKSHMREALEGKQKVLLLKGIREQYTLINDHDIPSISRPGEILVKGCGYSA